MEFLDRIQELCREPKVLLLLLMLPAIALVLAAPLAWVSAQGWDDDEWLNLESIVFEGSYAQKPSLLSALECSLEDWEGENREKGNLEEDALVEEDWEEDSSGEDYLAEEDWEEGDSEEEAWAEDGLDEGYSGEDYLEEDGGLCLPEASGLALGFFGAPGYGIYLLDLEELVYWAAQVLWGAISVLFIMGLSRMMYAGKWSFKQFRGVFTKGNVLLTAVIAMTLFQVAAASDEAGLVILPLMGFLAFGMLAFIAVDNNLASSVALSIRRLKDVKSYKVFAMVYLAYLLLSAVFLLPILAASSMKGMAEHVVEFILLSVLTLLIVAVQAIGMRMLVALAAADPETKVIISKYEKKGVPEEQRMEVAESKVSKMRSKGVKDVDIVSELRAMRLSVEEVEGLLKK